MNLKLFLVRCMSLVVAFSSLALSSYDAQAYQTNLSAGVYIPGIDVGEYSAPVVYDWNGDGSKDLIIGSRSGTSATGYHGYVNFYQNTGSDGSPAFSSSSFLESCTLTCSAIDAIAGG